MKKGTLTKLLAVSMSCVLVAGVALNHSVKSNANEVSKDDIQNQEMQELLGQLDCVKDIKTKNGTTEYVVELEGKEFTYTVSGSGENAKITVKEEGSKDQIQLKKNDDKVDIVEKTYENNKKVTKKIGQVDLVEETGASETVELSEEEKEFFVKTYARAFDKKYTGDIDYWMDNNPFEIKIGCNNETNRTKYAFDIKQLTNEQALHVGKYVDSVRAYNELSEKHAKYVRNLINDKEYALITVIAGVSVSVSAGILFGLGLMVVATGEILGIMYYFVKKMKPTLDEIDSILDRIDEEYINAAKYGMPY